MRASAVLLLLLPAVAVAHGVKSTVENGAAVVVTVSHEDGSPLAFENCVILGPGDEAPYQAGRTDRHGRVAFVPDRAGEWRVRVTAADGHGDDVTVTVDDAMVAAPRTAERPHGAWKALAGVGIILGVFGVVAFVQARRT